MGSSRVPRPPRFLLVDDEPTVLRSLKRMLRSLRFDWEVITAFDGLEALERLQERSFDAVMMDLQMPRMDGFALLEELRANYPQVVRIVHSARQDALDHPQLDRLAHRILMKPATMSDIVSTLEWALAQRRATFMDSESDAS